MVAYKKIKVFISYSLNISYTNIAFLMYLSKQTEMPLTIIFAHLITSTTGMEWINCLPVISKNLDFYCGLINDYYNMTNKAKYEVVYLKQLL